jgi:hypothetical protein
VKIGLINTRGLGDIIVAIPLAYWFIRQGHQVYFPIDRRFIPHFLNSAPEIRWMPVEPDSEEYLGPKGSERYYINEPTELLKSAGVHKVHYLYQQSHRALVPLSRALRWDEVKYAIAGVPFSEKWNLPQCIRRWPEREQELFYMKWPRRPYCIAHTDGSDFDSTFAEGPLEYFAGGLPIVRISPETDCLFDWLLLIERAARVFMLDSVYANLTDQMGIRSPKALHFRNNQLPPILMHGWQYVWPNSPPLLDPEIADPLQASMPPPE